MVTGHRHRIEERGQEENDPRYNLVYEIECLMQFELYVPR